MIQLHDKANIILEMELLRINFDSVFQEILKGIAEVKSNWNGFLEVLELLEQK